MNSQALAASKPQAAQVNALRIQSFYTALQTADLQGIAANYDENAYFEDIAFRCRGKADIMAMWRFVCHARPEVTFDAAAISADDLTGSGRWRARYVFGKTATNPGRPVDNRIDSSFVFRGGLIVEHRDHCDAMVWARQALPFPMSLVAGSIAPLRRGFAAWSFHKFSKSAGPSPRP